MGSSKSRGGEVTPCGCADASSVTRRSFLARSTTAVGALLYFLAHPLQARAVFEDGGPCSDPVPDLQFCWEELWYDCGRRVCEIWCWCVWESRDHGNYCGSQIIVLGRC